MKYKEKEYEVKILQESRNGERGELTIAYIQLDDGSQIIGVAERSKRDRYDSEQGKTVAVGRLQKKLETLSSQKINVPIV